MVILVLFLMRFSSIVISMPARLESVIACAYVTSVVLCATPISVILVVAAPALHSTPVPMASLIALAWSAVKVLSVSAAPFAVKPPVLAMPAKLKLSSLPLAVTSNTKSPILTASPAAPPTVPSAFL